MTEKQVGVLPLFPRLPCYGMATPVAVFRGLRQREAEKDATMGRLLVLLRSRFPSVQTWEIEEILARQPRLAELSLAQTVAFASAVLQVSLP